MNCIDCIAIAVVASFVMEHSSHPHYEGESSTRNCCLIQSTSVAIMHEDSIHYLSESNNRATQMQMDCCNLVPHCNFVLSGMMYRALIVNCFVTC